MESRDRSDFETRCAGVAQAARNAGLSFAKAPKGHALVISGNGRELTFPIATDEADWRKTSPEAALYVVLLDAHGWASANLDDATLATLDATERGEVPLLRKDLGEEMGRVRDLAVMLGGADGLGRLWAAAALDATPLSAVQ